VPLPRFIDEVNRLFDELVRDPWERRLHPPVTRETARGTKEVDFSVPVAAGARGNVSVALEGRDLVVTVHQRRSSRRTAAGETLTSHRRQDVQHRFKLPPGTEVISVTMWFEEATLRVRATLEGTES
jgi:HSP20 family molecular chaperone IbpA